MQVTGADIWQAREPLQSLLKEPWPVKTAYWLAKLARKIGEQYAVIDQVRVKLIQQYGTAKENGQISVEPGDENWAQFVVAFNELMAQEEELAIEKIILPMATELQVTPATLLALEPFIEVVE